MKLELTNPVKLASLQGTEICISLALQRGYFRHRLLHPALLGAGDPRTDSHACAVSTFPTELPGPKTAKFKSKSHKYSLRKTEKIGRM